MPGKTFTAYHYAAHKLPEVKYTKKLPRPLWCFIATVVLHVVMGVNSVKAQPVLSPAGTYWLAVEIEGHVLGAEYRRWQPLLFFSTGQGELRVQGLTGCRQLSAIFRQSGNSMRFEQLTASGMNCSPFLQALEAAFLGALQTTVSGQVSGDMLELKNAAGRVCLRLQAAQPH